MKGPKAERIAGLRQPLLELHKAMLDAQRIRYERAHGRIETRGEFLGRVLHHPDFEWIRALSTLIAQLDEWAEEESAGNDADLAAIVEAVRALVQPAGENAAFSCRYWDLVENEPAVTMAHVKVWRVVDGPPPAPPDVQQGTPSPEA